MRKTRPLAAVVAALACFMPLPEIRAQTAPFYDDAKILSVAEPVVLGEELFVRRSSELAGGAEPFGLVLSGGSARAFAHIGVLEALEAEGLRPDFVVADSMGAIVALLYCAGVAPEDIAALFDAFPANRLFDPEFPLSGGFLDAGRFLGLVRALTGELDLADLPIPAMVACEDLISRRQVLAAEGDFATVAAASFALPAVFEPVRLGEFLLIDGGVTSLVPVEAAYRYSSRIAAATALYDRAMDFSSPFVVINRALDLGKTRSSVRGMLERRPVVIRCDVETLSYMQFSRPAEVAARGFESARAAMGELKAIASAAREPSAELARRRAYYHGRIARLAAAARLGAGFAGPADLLASAEARFLDEASGGFDVFRGRRWIGPAVEARLGPARLALSALAGIESDEARAWGLGLRVGFDSYIFPRDEGALSGLALRSSLRAVLSGSGVLDGALSAPEPRELAAAAEASASFEPFGGLIARPEARAELAMPLGGEASWAATADLSLEAGSQGGAPSRIGAALAGGWAFDSFGNAGPVGRAGIEWAPGGIVALRARGVYRGVLEGPGIEAAESDPYRSAAIGGLSSARFLAGAEAAWIARPLELSFGELVIIEKPELGAYVDFSGALPAEGGPVGTRLTIGAAASAGFSIMGLAPIVVSAFAGAATDGSGWAFGLRAGRSFE